ncbi:hypothetical protein JW933_09040 [candidate division FCPU426 bacterium]|nr:hypothetical protein [candidate division FCPU426 bacterium]
MKSDWTIRWWDIVALTMAMGAAVMVVQYSIARGTNLEGTSGLALVEVRVPKPLPELVAQLAQGDVLQNREGEKVGEILSVQPVPSLDNPGISVPLAGRQDVKLMLRVQGALRLVRDCPGFPREPAALKAGVWCLINTKKVELSGMVTKVKEYQEEQGVAKKQLP